jgi:MFS superfamily sulfate permease-like transporter
MTKEKKEETIIYAIVILILVILEIFRGLVFGVW